MTPEEERADAKEASRLIREESKQQRWNAGFFNMDSRILAEIPDDQLAARQAGVRPETPQYIRTEHEWQRRLITRQIRSARWTALIAGVMGIVGVIVGVLLNWWIMHHT
jgi:hypothetical protein